MDPLGDLCEIFASDAYPLFPIGDKLVTTACIATEIVTKPGNKTNITCRIHFYVFIKQ
ncbi:hypothetical protein IYQ_03938 [Aeromonas salmonicida subsp. salmonicida 01-B526]|uniref:Uncharacterized protein n=1 Tax=Aeromonas salmonicida subsp. salmonicida 01-B526 TaxID=1076135 RepID=A0ABP2N5F2_AERSS|nr:hypothetical protein IYQ_03938 [Aeromonas salmonicida subsp. salmonicida 01-B526]